MLKKSENLKIDDLILTEDIIQSATIQTRHDFYSFAKHIHTNIELYELTSGNCSMEIGNEVVSCHKGDFVLVLPNVVHSFYLTSKERCVFKHIHFSPEVFSKISLEKITGCPLDLLTSLTFCCGYFLHIKANQHISSIFSSIINTFKKGTSFSAAYSNLYLTELLLYIIETSEKDLSSYSQKHSEQNDYVSFALKYIQKNYASKIVIKDIADCLNISTRYLSKIFHNHMNMTILSYINVYRINRAVDLMANTNFTMTEIADKIGMNDSQHFSKLFKSTIGSSPLQYRKILLKEDYQW